MGGKKKSKVSNNPNKRDKAGSPKNTPKKSGKSGKCK